MGVPHGYSLNSKAMPPLNPVSKVIRVAMSGLDTTGATIANRIFFQYSGTLSQNDLITLVNTFDAAYGAQLQPQLSNDFTLNQWVATDLTSNSAPQVVLGVSRVGGSSVAPMAASSAMIIKFKIARRYRGGHPRFYFGPLPSGNLASASIWVGTYRTTIKNAFSAFIAACETTPPAAVGTLTHVNVHYFSGFTNKTFPSGRVKPVPVPLPTPTVDTISGYDTNPTVGNQRRRNRQSL